MIVPEQQLASHSFSERDAVFVTDGVQVEFLKSKSNASLSRSRLLPLSTQAYAAVLNLGHRNVRSYFEFVDFDECKSWYGELGLGHSRTWLRELRLEFQVEGIDIAELDAPCQFLLFIQATYIAGTAERLILATPEIETFYLIEAEQRLPQDFYFDSDVPAAVLRFVCERLGRPVRTIVMKERPRYVFPYLQRRPIMDGQPDCTISDQPALKLPRSSRRRVGFAPATVANAQQILGAIRKLGCPMVVFPSIWSTLQIFDSGSPEKNEYVFSLSAVDGEWSTAVAARLTDLWKEFLQRRARSTLPGCIIGNPHLNFQFDYIFKRRWWSYANMIHRAVRFVGGTPLDLFIQSDHFTAEGAILARLYRRTPTRVIVALHSGWPCDRNWACWDSSDSAMVPSKSCAKKLRELSGMSHVFVTGALAGRSYRSLIHLPALAAKKRYAAGDRKIVLFITNALELNCFPFTALDSYFETLASIVRIPESLKDRILIVIRTKPGELGDDPILYRELSGVPPENLTFLEGLDFSQSVEVADCVVGFNIPTTGYFDVLQKGVPLLHVQAADVTSLQPDLPSEVVPRVTGLPDIWPAIEAMLFDERHRERVLDFQRRFVAADFTPTVSSDGDPVEALIGRLLGSRNRPNLSSFAGTLWQRITGRLQPSRPFLPQPVESCLPRCQQGGAGHVDDVLLGSDGTAVVIGWAADMVARRPAKAVHVFLNGVRVGEGSLGRRRPDVAAFHNDERLEQTGFSVRLASVEEEQVAMLSVYSELHDGTFFELQKQ